MRCASGWTKKHQSATLPTGQVAVHGDEGQPSALKSCSDGLTDFWLLLRLRPTSNSVQVRGRVRDVCSFRSSEIEILVVRLLARPPHGPLWPPPAWKLATHYPTQAEARHISRNFNSTTLGRTRRTPLVPAVFNFTRLNF